MVQLIVTAIILAILGVIDTAYLFYRSRQKKPMICPMNHDCSVVTESKWNKTFFVKNDTLGLIFYIGVLILLIIGFYKTDLRQLLYTLMLIGTGGGILFSAFLVYVQLKIIKDYCFYCMVSAGINLLLFINILALFLGY